MPFREYYCEDCDTQFEHKCSFTDPIIKVCPDCSSEEFYQDLTGLHVAVRGHNTVGAIGEINSKRDKNKLQEQAARKKEREREEFEVRRQRIEQAVPGSKLYFKDDIPEPTFESMPKQKRKELFIDKKGDAQIKAIDKYIMEGK